jgi:ABC-type transport system substrate-binding protein
MVTAILRAAAVAAAVCLSAAAHAHADPAKVLRVTSKDIASLDPQQGTDLRSTRVASAIFEGLYQFDYLTEPAKVVPNTAEAMPVITGGGKVWTIKLLRGIHFTDSSAFKGKPRELVAEDYVYSIKRSLDPNLLGGGDPALANLIEGARPVVDAASKAGAQFDYDAPMAGLHAIDRYTLQMRLTSVDYTLLERLAGLSMTAVAREVVEAAGSDIKSQPVGTGPYMLKEWKRATRVVLEANPNYRGLHFPESTDPRQHALAQSMRGKTLPQIGRIEISIIEESQPSLLAFAQGDLDYLGLAGNDLKRVLVGNELEPDLARKGVVRMRYNLLSLTFTYFNMKDPLVGGYSNAQIALRRAIAMGFNIDELIRVLYGGEALPANQLLPPGVDGHDDSLPPKSIYNPAAARALLDRFGFKDRDGDGYRETPDGKPLTLVRGTLPESWFREIDTLWKKNMDAIGIRMQVVQKTFSELMDMSRGGKLMMFNLAYRSLEPSGYEILQTLWSRSPVDGNPSHSQTPTTTAPTSSSCRRPPDPVASRSRAGCQTSRRPTCRCSSGRSGLAIRSSTRGWRAIGRRNLASPGNIWTSISRSERRQASSIGLWRPNVPGLAIDPAIMPSYP